MQQPSPTDSRRVSVPSWLRWFLRFFLGIAIVAFLASRHDFSDLQRVLSTTSWPVLAGSIAFFWLGQMLSAWKWKLLLDAQGAGVSLAHCCKLYLVGMFWNLWMPTSIGGDTVRTLRCGALCSSRSVAASSILVERATGLVALIAIGSVAFIAQIVTSPLASSDTTRLLVGLFLFFSVAIALAAIIFSRSSRKSPSASHSRFSQKLLALREALLFYLTPQRRGLLLISLLLSLVFQASQIVLNIALARAIGLSLEPLIFWWLVPALALASLLPLGIGGLGVREAAAVQFLSPFSASASQVIAWSLLWQATVWLTSLPGIIWASDTSTRNNTKQKQQ